LVDGLLEAGAVVRVHDPQALESARNHYGDRIQYADDMYGTVAGADALVLATEWHQYRRPDFGKIHANMAGKLLVDGRNVWDPAELKELGFRYLGVGRS
jgi:UDPglucose 6-dehydrogenase